MQRQSAENVDTHLGAFGPGADLKRRRAASPPPRLIKSEFVIVEVPIKADVYLSLFTYIILVRMCSVLYGFF